MSTEPETQRRNESNAPYQLAFFLPISFGIVVAIYFTWLHTIGPFAGLVPVDEFYRRCDASARNYVAGLSGTLQTTSYFHSSRKIMGRRNSRTARENLEGIRINYLDSGGQSREFTGDCRIDRHDARAVIE